LKPTGGRDICHGDPVDPVLVEEFFRRFKDSPPLAFAMAAVEVGG
jgi:hypothetical protein